MTGVPEIDADAAVREGLAHHRAGRLAEAQSCYDEVLAALPDHPDALHFSGLLAQARGDLKAAEVFIRRAIAGAPDRPTSHFNLGVVLSGRNDLAGAIAAFARASELDPASVPAFYNLGLCRGRAGDGQAAEAAFRAAVALDPGHAGAWAGLGAALHRQGHDKEAEATCRKALALDPRNLEALTNLGNALQRIGRLGEAETAQRTAIGIDPAYALAHYNLGNLLNRQWRVTEATESFRRAADLTPGYLDAETNYLLNLIYQPDQSEESLFEAHRRWAARFDRDAQPAAAFANSRDADRPLRVGYLSPDFRTHSCAYFIEPLFRAHDRREVEVIAFSNVVQPDDKTASLRGLADAWHDVTALDDVSLAELIRRERIDILVDLAGLTRGGRIAVFVRRAAPVQVSWLGYPSTTGLRALDARITDVVADPPGDADRWHTERLVRLDGGFLCYGAPDDTPDVAPMPSRQTGRITFGSFNNILKITSDVVGVWARLLDAVPGARLLLKSVILDVPETRARITAAFAALGVGEDRIQFADWIPRDAQPMTLYDEIDVALDPFPYNGTTTTFEALWMGVPVITLAGSRHAGRVGASILSAIGRSELIAVSPDEYVAKAAALAADPGRLDELRGTLRHALGASPLMDEKRLAAGVEAAYRDLWKAWCGS